MNRILTFAALIGLVLTGCTLAPEYHRPAAPVAAAWPQGATTKTDKPAARAAADIGWREFFRDARLRDLIGLALTNNRDLRVAVLNVQVAQAQYRIQRADLLPQIAGTGSFTRQRSPAYQLFQGENAVNNQYSLGVGTTAYELDLFGRVRSLKAQALEKYFATGEARMNAQMALVAAVAEQYLTWVELNEQLGVADRTLKSVQQTYDLNRRSYDAGNASELDLRTAEAQVASARVSVAGYEQQRSQAEHALVLLVGRDLPAQLPRGRSLEQERVIGDLPAGLPADLLLRRPDIREAEYQLEAANANIGAARAAFLPTIKITANAGVASSQLTSLFATGSGTWLFNPEITVPIFAAGQNKANLEVAKLNKQIEVANYEKAIQTAFREVADGLAAKAFLDAQVAGQEQLVKAEQRRYDLAEARYRVGTDSYLTVLSAQQELYAAQQNMLSLRYARLANLIGLYQALGGGWQ